MIVNELTRSHLKQQFPGCTIWRENGRLTVASNNVKWLLGLKLETSFRYLYSVWTRDNGTEFATIEFIK
jgi:hypothetical protein